jgi:hypothetical protein
MATVASVYAASIDGYDVTAGEIEWIDNGLGNAVDRREGHGVFVVVRLPHAVPSTAVRAYRTLPSRRAGEDEFRRRFRIICTDAAFAARLDDPALRAAQVSAEIPPWTLIDDQLFAFVPLDTPLTPRAVEDAVDRTLQVLHLLRVDVR